jgi:hypothetical protein
LLKTPGRRNRIMMTVFADTFMIATRMEQAEVRSVIKPDEVRPTAWRARVRRWRSALARSPRLP